MPSTISDLINDTVADDAQSSGRPASAVSSAAQRMRLLRQRRRDGLVCVIVEVHEREIRQLARLGYMRRPSRSRSTIAKAVHKLFDDALAPESDE
jgi:hypothetical protein